MGNKQNAGTPKILVYLVYSYAANLFRSYVGQELR